jgi:hypothetical protein
MIQLETMFAVMNIWLEVIITNALLGFNSEVTSGATSF